jgi:hypothetical protein
MKITYTTNNRQMTIELEASTHVELVQQLSSFSEVFEEDTCKKCKSKNLRWNVRSAKDAKGVEHDYHELLCKDCGAKLPFGVKNDKTFRLFPKRKDAEGNVRGKWGWVKWNPETEQEE